jgi:serine/threonine protein kinase
VAKGVEVEAGSQRWRQVGESQYPWETDALNVLRELLPDAAPFQAWTNFEFTDGGRIHEVDALVITPKGGFVIEIKGWSGEVRGDQGRWTQIRNDGSRESHPNAANLTAQKVRAIASLVSHYWNPGHQAGVPRTIFLQPIVWFSHPDLRLHLPAELRTKIAVADGLDGSPFLGIRDALITIGAEEANRQFERITAPQSDQFVAAMERIGIRGSTPTRTAGTYVLDLPAFAERGNAQDFTAVHRHTGRRARVRIYSNVAGMGPDQARALKDAAHREYTAAGNLRRLDGVVDAIDLDQTEFGPAVIFEHDQAWRRLDQFLGELPAPLSPAKALKLVEGLADTLREIHKQRITHRMLTPQSVWLKLRKADGVPSPVPMITDLSLAAQESHTIATTTSTYTRVGRLPAAGTGAVELVVGDVSAETYLAPEAFTDPGADGVTLDVFSLGALAYLLITGRPPAADRAELRAALGQNGLSLAAVMPEVDPALEAVVRRCTTPIVTDRYQRMAEVSAALAVARAAVTGERLAEQADPLLAEPGDTIAGRFEVVRRLGQGSTATALWCRDLTHDRDVVLKVSLGGPCDERVRMEGGRLADLSQANIVTLADQVDLAERPTLVLSFAGERSLADVLRDEGAVSPEFLQRWGDDLLEAVRYLEKVGVSHRDIKPDNLGLAEMGPSKEQHLVLYDFSLASARAVDTDAGTPPYLEPFLGAERPFDLAAERYAAAVTLHEMATGDTPVWGDGRTAPEFLPEDTEATLLVEALDEGLREPLGAFLAQALRRDPAERFDTAEDMLRAWNAVFAGWEVPEVHDDEPAGVAEAAGGPAALLPDNLTLDDPIASLRTSRKLASALRKVGAGTVREVAGLDAALVNRTRGVSVKTRRQVVRLRAAVLERFAEELAGEQPSRPITAVPASTPNTDETPTDAPSGHVADLDTLGLRLVPPRGARGKAGKVADSVRLLLGLDRLPDGAVADDWPTATAVATALDLTRAAASNAHQKAREHWGDSADLVGVIPDLVSALVDLGGVAGVSELAAPLLDARPCGLDPPEARRLAAAVVRAAVEASGAGVPEGVFSVRRFGRRTVLAVNGPVVAALIEAGHPAFAGWDRPVDWPAFDPDALVNLAVALGRRADELVAEAALVTSSDVVPALRGVRSDAGRALSDSRLVRLAAASSDHATANPGSDLVASAVAPVDALRWSRPSLIGSSRLTTADVRDRVAVRFPTVTLPDRPALDEAFAAAGLPYVWQSSDDAYVSTAKPVGGQQLTIGPARAATRLSPSGHTQAATDPQLPEVADALAVQQRLDASVAEGGFLALRIPTDRLVDARAGLGRWTTGDNALVEMDLEATFLQHLRFEAERRKVVWSNVESADDRAGAGWTRLSVLAAAAVEATIAEVRAQRRVLAWFPGALVRHGGDLTPSPLDQLRDAATGGGGDLELLWLVTLGGQADALPAVDGTPVPIVAPSEWLEITDPWLSNAHRGTATDATTGAGDRSA